MTDASSVAAIMGGSFLITLLLGLVINIVCAVVVHKNGSNFSEQAWQMSGQSKTLWVVLSFFFSWIGLLIYFLAIKPKVEAAQAQLAGGYPGQPAPQQGYQPPAQPGYPAQPPAQPQA